MQKNRSQKITREKTRLSILLSFIRVSRLSENDKDLEIIILRHQLDVMVRKHKQPVRPNQDAESLIVRLAKENLRWGYYRIEGELSTRMLLILFLSLKVFALFPHRFKLPMPMLTLNAGCEL